MKKRMSELLSALCLGGLLMVSTASHADVITDIEDIDTTVGGFLGIPSFSWTHTLEDFTLGSAMSGVLTIEMRDDESDFCGFLGCVGEVTSVIVGIIDFQDGSILFNPNDGPFSSDLGIFSIAGLNLTGALAVTLLPTGDFWVGRSTLEVTTRGGNAQAVPEPATLGLLGLGLMGIGLSSRRRSRKQA